MGDVRSKEVNIIYAEIQLNYTKENISNAILLTGMSIVIVVFIYESYFMT